MRDIRLSVSPARQTIENYDWSLFRLHDGVTVGTSTEAAVDANSDNTWELTLGNFNAAQWTGKNGWWTGAIVSSYYADLVSTSFAADAAKFLTPAAYSGKCTLVACQISTPAYATAAQRIIAAGISNNAELWNLRYLTGDVLAFYCAQDGANSGSLDISSYLDTDLVFAAIIDDRPGEKQLYTQVYLAGTQTLLLSSTVSLASITWSTSAAARYLSIGRQPNNASNYYGGSVRRVLIVPMGGQPPADFSAIMEELALHRITRFNSFQ